MTKRRASGTRKRYRPERYYDLLYGPLRDDPNAPAVDDLRDAWEGGGREDVMGSPEGWRPGFRPWAWWAFDFPDECKREAELLGIAAPKLHSMALLELAGLARPGEREAYDRDQAYRKWIEGT